MIETYAKVKPAMDDGFEHKQRNYSWTNLKIETDFLRICLVHGMEGLFLIFANLDVLFGE